MPGSPVLRALAILRRLGERGGPVGAQELAGEARLNVSTVHRLLQLMPQDGMVAYDADSRIYSVGIEGIRFATQVLGSGSLTDRVRPRFAELAAQLGETCAFSLYEPKTFSARTRCSRLRLCCRHARQHSRRRQRQADPGFFARRGDRALSAQTLVAGYRAYHRRSPPAAPTDPAHPQARVCDLSQRTRQGAATGVGAPVFGPKGQVVGSDVVTIPSFR
ncbi:MAG: helix-turn-helix domain-containing protein [Hyphomicrobiaceae bacterium]|nr:helix-turn-helix domain-containing protein [Hyphomicrobiaceae bacterium]